MLFLVMSYRITIPHNIPSSHPTTQHPIIPSHHTISRLTHLAVTSAFRSSPTSNSLPSDVALPAAAAAESRLERLRGGGGREIG